MLIVNSFSTTTYIGKHGETVREQKCLRDFLVLEEEKCTECKGYKGNDERWITTWY